MGWTDVFQISASGLTAQRLRMDVISNNIANAQSTRNAEGTGPYMREKVSFQSVLQSKAQQSGMGVSASVEADTDTPFKLVYDPQHPDANKDPNSPLYGYVQMPNVDIATEMVDMISASRGYEANVTAFNAAKSMALKALEIGRA